MAVDLDTFLAPVVSRVIALAEHVDDQGDLKTTDAIILAWARQAHSHLVTWCNRPFVEATYTDEYDGVETRALLRVAPVSSITSAKIIGFDDNLDTDSYSLDNNEIVLNSTFANFVSGEGADTDIPPRDIRVIYLGGLASIASGEDEILLSAIASQTMMWWQGRSLMGLKRTSGGGFNSETVTSNMEISPEVKDMLHDYRYLGAGFGV